MPESETGTATVKEPPHLRGRWGCDRGTGRGVHTWHTTALNTDALPARRRLFQVDVGAERDCATTRRNLRNEACGWPAEVEGEWQDDIAPRDVHGLRVGCGNEQQEQGGGAPLTAAEQDLAHARVRGTKSPPWTLEHAGPTTCRRARIG